MRTLGLAHKEVWIEKKGVTVGQMGCKEEGYLMCCWGVYKGGTGVLIHSDGVLLKRLSPLLSFWFLVF